MTSTGNFFLNSRVYIILNLEEVIDHCLKGELVEYGGLHIKPSAQMKRGE